MQLVSPSKKRDRVIRFQLLWNKIVLNYTEVRLIAGLALVVGYMLWASPAAMMTACIVGLFAVAFGLFNQSLQTATGFGLPIKAWHLGSLVIAVSAVAAAGAIDPVSAQMFNNLEEAVTDAIAETGDSAIDTAVITTIFNIFRILIVLAFLIGVVIVFTQATRGGDWQPIANLLAIGVAFVIGVEVISQLIIGDGTGGAGEDAG